MTQVCEQYNIEAQNTSVTVYHLDDTKEAFSSFERFRIYNQSATSPVESVVLKYNFLIVLPRTRKAQSRVSKKAKNHPKFIAQFSALVKSA